MATRIVYFLADDTPNSTEQAELKELNKSLQVTVMNASENVEFGENDRILPCDFVAGTIPPEYAHIPVYDISGTSGGPIYIDDVVGLPAALDAKADKPVGIEDVTGLQTELDDIHVELDAAATLPIAISDVTGLQTALDAPVGINEVTGLQAELDTKAELPIAISDVTGLQEELDAVALLPINISDVTGLQTELDSKATLTELQTVITALDAKADAPVQIQDVEGLEEELDSVATLPIAISDVTGLQEALDNVATLPIEISDVTGLQAELDSVASLPIAISDVTGLQAELDAPVAISEVTGLQTALNSKANVTDLDPIIAELSSKQDAPVLISDVTGLQTELNSKAAAIHAHSIADVTGLQTELDTIHTELDSAATLPIEISDVTGLQAELDAPVPISDVTGLQAELDSKAELADLDPIIADLNTKAELPIPISGVTNLQTTLDGKAPVSHAHTIANVTGLQAALDSKAATPVPISNVTGLQASLDSKATAVHGHAIADVGGLQTALDGKSATTHVHAVATTSVDGFFSKTDKAKLDGVATGATAITFPAANAAGTLASGAPQPANAGADVLAARSDHQHPAASATNSGLMTPAQVIALTSNGAQVSVGGTTHTLQISNAGKTINFSSPSPCTLTIPNTSTVDLGLGTEVFLFQGGLGQITIVGVAGVTLLVPPGKSAVSTGVNSTIRIYQIVANYWVLEGDLVDATAFLTLSATAGYPNERVFTPDTGIQVSDGGAGGTYKISSTGNGAANYTIAPTYTVSLVDAGKTVQCDGLNTVVTIPNNTTVPHPVGTEIFFFGTSGPMSFVAGSGNAIYVPTGKSALSVGPWSTVRAYQAAINAWILEGDLVDSTSYLTLAATTRHPNERVLTPDTGIQVIDGGAGSTYKISATGNGAPVSAPNTTYYPVVTDIGKTIRFSNSANIICTLPEDSALAFATGGFFYANQFGTGKVTFSDDVYSAVTRVKTKSNRTNGANSFVKAYKSGADQWTISGDLENIIPISTVTAAYTTTINDVNNQISVNSAIAVTVTISPYANVINETGAWFEIAQQGTGQVTIAPGAGVTLQSPGSLVKTKTRYSTIRCLLVEWNTWRLSGDLG